jgi:long-chain acyl-CoA synthetase
MGASYRCPGDPAATAGVATERSAMDPTSQPPQSRYVEVLAYSRGMSLNLATLLRESAKAHPAKPAIHVGEVTLSYGALDDLAQRFAAGLRRLGVHPGQHVALLLPNVPQFTIAYFGCHYAGNPVVPLNVLLTADEIAYHLADSDAVALVAWEGFYDAAHGGFARVDACAHLIVAKADRADLTAPAGAHNLVELVAGPPLGDLHPTNPDDTAVILYTSGTTGKAKGAELSHFNLFFNAQWLTRQPMPVSLSEAVVMVVLPLFHSFGQTVMQNSTLLAGGTLVLMPRFEPVGAAQLIAKHRINVFAGVPTMYFALLHHPDVTPAMLATLGQCLSGGAAMPVEVMAAFDGKFGTDILEGYGLSETSPVASFNPRGAKKAGSIGRPIWGVEFRLVDGEGQVVTEVGQARRDLHQGPQRHEGLLPAPRRHRRGHHRRLVPLGRRRHPRRRRLLLHRRSQEGHDHPRRLQRVPARDRGGPVRPPGGGRGRGGRRGPRQPGRGGQGGGRVQARPHRHRRRAHRLLQGAPGGVQVPADRRAARRPAQGADR